MKSKLPQLVLALLTTCSLALAQTSVPSTFWGMHVQNLKRWPMVTFGTLGKCITTTWPYLEQTRGVFNWSALDHCVAATQAHNMDVFWANDGVPKWAAADPSTCAPLPWAPNVIPCTSAVSNVQDITDFFTALATRYKGRHLNYELWNEPDGPKFYTGTLSQMVQMTTAAYNAIRAADPTARIFSPSGNTIVWGSTPSYMDDYFAAGGTQAVDVVTFHSDPCRYGPEYSAAIDGVKSVMTKHNLSSKELWNTEGSWGTCSLSIDQQVAFVARFHLYQWSRGVRRVYWYQWDNQSWGTLWTSGTGPTAAAIAYQQVYNWMVGTTMTKLCAKESDGSTWMCELTRPDGTKNLAVWNTAGSKTFVPDVYYNRYRDLAGNTTPIVADSVRIGIKPILLEP